MGLTKKKTYAAWYQANKDRINARKRAYRAAHPEKRHGTSPEKMKEWREKNKEHRAEYSKKYAPVMAANIKKLNEGYETAPQRKQCWTIADEQAVISRFVNKDMSIKELAVLLGRSWHAVKRKQDRLMTKKID